MPNLFQGPLNPLPDELIETLVATDTVRVERIVSTGQASPPGFWYDQEEAEWVVVLQGEAGLRLAGETSPLHLRAGDYVHIAAHRRHRVEWTSTQGPTVWLAVFFRQS